MLVAVNNVGVKPTQAATKRNACSGSLRSAVTVFVYSIDTERYTSQIPNEPCGAVEASPETHDQITLQSDPWTVDLFTQTHVRKCKPNPNTNP